MAELYIITQDVSTFTSTQDIKEIVTGF